MPKADNVSFLERHVEKIVLVGCFLLLVAAGYRWVLSSPVSLTVIGPEGTGRVTVGPEEVDDVLGQAALSVKGKHDRAKVFVKPVIKCAGKTVEMYHPIVPPARETVDVAMPRPPVKLPIVGGEEEGIRLPQLIAAMPTPPKPIVIAAMTLPEKDKLVDVVVAHGTCQYPVAELTAAWTEMLKKKKIPVNATVHKIIVQRQRRLRDGQWGPVETAQLAAKPDAEGNPVTVPSIPAFDGKNVENVREARDAVGKVQTHVLQPAYYRVYSPGRGWVNWQPPAPPAQAVKTDAAPAAAGDTPAAAAKTPIWFHDETLSVASGYRYRVKLVFVNPILTYDKVVSDEHLAEARQTFIETKESEWSDPVSVEQSVHFFLTGASETTGQMTVTIFASKWAQTVRQAFPVRRGEPIGGVTKARIRNPNTGEIEPAAVDFSTGAISLEFRFDIKDVRPGGLAVTTAKMVYLDSQGRLKARVQARDSDDPVREKLTEQAKQAAGGG